MADVPPEFDDAAAPAASEPEPQFLSALWDRLERAQTLSSSREAMDALPQILRHCEEAVALIKDQLSKPA